MAEEIQEPTFVPLGSQHYSVPSTYGNPVQDISLMELAIGLDGAIGELTERQQQVIRHRIYEQKNLTETAKEMGVTKERVRSLQAKSLGKLKRKTSYTSYLIESAQNLGISAS